MEGLINEQMVTRFAELAAAWGLRLLGALAILLLGRILAGWIRRAVRLTLRRTEVDETLVPFVSALAYYLVLAFVVIAALSALEVSVASFVAVVGAAGLAIALAFQGTLANFAAGVMILIFRPFAKGDFVEVGSVSGTVREVRLFTTTLDTPDNIRIVVPNSEIWGNTIKNYSANDTRRLDLAVGIGYDDDIAQAIEVLRRVLAQDERVLAEPQAVVAVSELADSSVNLTVLPWCRRQDYWAVRWDLTRRFKEELTAAGCSIPYPQHDVHLFQEGATAAA